MEGEEDNNTNISTTERLRIHVGGLGESVTRDDLSNLLTKVGIGFQSVEIIRSKGRSFAYIDFLPSSLNNLPKLYTTYNGCVWKGGRLRLEKAKEHYLDRLKREWAEDAQLASSTSGIDLNNDVDKKMESPQKPKKDLNLENKQLRIFIPRLQKLKSIPFRGSGKHRYSFRRVEVPALPTHFCDCEEHSGSLNAPKEKQISSLEGQGGGVNQEELDMMNSVMNRLFEMENISGAPHSENELTKEEGYFMKVTDDPQLDESEGYSTADEDNLIINVVRRRKDTAFTNEESKLNKRKASEDRPVQEMLKKKTRNLEENDSNKNVSAIPRGKENLQAPSNGPGILSGDELIESQSSIKRSASGVSWSQKFSWRELVADKSNSAINISDILPSASSSKEEGTKSDATLNSKIRRNKKLLKHENQRSQLDKSEVVTAEAQGTELDSASDNVEAQDTKLGCTSDKAEAQDTKLRSASDKADTQDRKLGSASDKAEAQDAKLGSASYKAEAQDTKFCSSSDNGDAQDTQLGSASDKAEAQNAKLGSASDKAGRGSAWLHNASWTQLVSSNNSSSFSITQILPGVTFDKQEPIKTDGDLIANSRGSNPGGSVETGKIDNSIDGTRDFGIGRDSNVKQTSESSQLIVMGNTGTSAPTEYKNNSATKQKGSGVVAIGETCTYMRTKESNNNTSASTENKNISATKQKVSGIVAFGETRPFMRTEESVKEWANIRAALSGSRKRTSKGKELHGAFY